MANIKLANYPYREYKVGEIVDLGEEKNKSMVSLQRAVWVEVEEKPKTSSARDDVVPAPSVLETTAVDNPDENESKQETEPVEKKFLQNELKEQIEQKKKSSPRKSFWDKLK